MNGYKVMTPDLVRRNPFQLIGREWMLVTAGNEEKVNAMTASWGGLGVMYGKNVSFIVIRPQRYTKEFIDREESFSLCFFTKEYKETLNYFGTVSGRNEDKIENSGLSIAFYEGTPYFDEASLVFICRKMYCQPMDIDGLVEDKLKNTWYPSKDVHTMYISEIMAVLQIKH